MARLILVALLAASARFAQAAAPIPVAEPSSCSGCHAADTPVPRLVGRNPAQIEAAMLAFRTRQKPASAMNRIAKGFSDEEVRRLVRRAEGLGGAR